MGRKPFRPVGKISRLQFSEEERTDATLEKPLKRAEKSADKMEKAKAQIPKKKKIVKECTFDADTGKTKVHLHFEEIDKPKPPSKLSQNLKTMPQRGLLSKIHKEIQESEQDNIGVEAAHKSEQGIELGARRLQSAYHSHKLRPYRQLAKAENEMVKAEVNYLYQKNLRDNPQAGTNPLSRWQQKQAIKKQYASAHSGKSIGAVQKTADNTKKVTSKVAEAMDNIKQFIIHHRKGFLLLLAIAAVVLLLMSMVSSCSILFEGGLSSIISTSYTSEDEDIIAVDNIYNSFEIALQQQIDKIEQEYPGYDEYRYDIAEIGHNPHELASYLTALLQYYKVNEVKDELQRVFDLQYKMTLSPVIEVRYRTETRTDSEGNTYTVEVPYNYYILNVKLQNFSVDSVAKKLLTGEQLKMYGVYLETRGNKPLLFGGGSSDSSPSTDLSGVKFQDGIRQGNQNLADIAKSQVGNIGGQPYWSWYGFDSRVEWCACFVSWCLNQAGYSEPKFAGCQSQGVPWFKQQGQWANGNYKDLAPGDVIFFDWDNSGNADHVGIVIGTDGKRVYTVEGNSGDACHIRDYDLNSNVIMGYGLMN